MNASIEAVPARAIATALSGYMCGTHSGLASVGRRVRRRPVPHLERVVAMHRLFRPPEDAKYAAIGGPEWEPSEPARALRDRLCSALDHPSIVDLVLFGSHARGGVTGFSDIDAILIVENEAAEDVRALRVLRARVLDSQRAVMTYQPMQHHGFEVATPKLLCAATDALALPAAALAGSRSLTGRTHVAALCDASDDTILRLRSLVQSVLAVRRWPRHPWEAHRLIAMFELLPSMYLQSRGKHVPKSESFTEARRDFGDAWWPYDVLDQIRATWPRTRRPLLEIGGFLLRNPWAAVAVWRRLPTSVAEPVRPLLTPELLVNLHALARRMAPAPAANRKGVVS